MAKTPATLIEVPANVKTAIDQYADADAAKKNAEATMKETKPMLVSAATEISNDLNATSVNMSSGKNIAQVTFATSYSLNEYAANYPNVKAIVDKGLLPCVAKTEGSVCIRGDKVNEIIAFLTSLGRSDLIVQNAPVYTFNREVFDAMEKTPTYQGRDELLDCLDTTITPRVTIKAIK